MTYPWAAGIDQVGGAALRVSQAEQSRRREFMLRGIADGDSHGIVARGNGSQQTDRERVEEIGKDADQGPPAGQSAKLFEGLGQPGHRLACGSRSHGVADQAQSLAPPFGRP